MSKFLDIELLKAADWLSLDKTTMTLRVKPNVKESCFFKPKLEWTICKPPENLVDTPLTIKLVDFLENKIDPKTKKPIVVPDPCLKTTDVEFFNLTAESY